MAGVELTFVGTGGAFGHGGRLQACISLRAGSFHTLIDCGSSSLIGLRRDGLDPSTVDAVLVTHFHSDHDGGVPWIVLDGQFSKRERPLVIAGPPGIRERAIQQLETTVPTLSQTRQRYEIRYLELGPTAAEVGPLRVRAVETIHTQQSVPRAVRIEVNGLAIAYTGDTEWTPALLDIARDADLLIAEGYSIEKQIPFHLSYAALMAHRDELRAKRIVLTHLGAETLERMGEVELECAHDGMRLAL